MKESVTFYAGTCTLLNKESTSCTYFPFICFLEICRDLEINLLVPSLFSFFFAYSKHVY